jgi:LysM repeat protein
MSFEKFNSPLQKENRYKNQKESNDQEDTKMNRRTFLKKMALITGGVVLSKPLLNLIEKESDKDTKGIDTDENFYESTEEQEMIDDSDIESLSDILEYDKEGKIELTPKKMEAIRNYWKDRYQNKPQLRESFEKAYYSMGEWEDYIKKEFKQRGVPEKYAYLAIPESHWQLRAKSRAGAVGPYQFMPKTAKMYGLKSSYFKDNPENLEERYDPIRSAEACAELLKDLYKAGGDWDLALSGYNGGFFWRYLKEARSRDEDFSYQGFLGFLEAKINSIRDKIKLNKTQHYKIKSGENLRVIAKKFSVDIDKLCKINNIKDRHKVFAGQLIEIPVEDEVKKNIFKAKIRGIEENLNYPPKFNAIIELIEEGFVTEKKEPINFETETVNFGYKKYIFKKEDKNLYRLSLKFSGISDKDILEVNPHIDPHSLRGGEELLIPDKNSSLTLKILAEKRGVDLEKIQSLNPAIIDSNRPLPKGYKVRV